MNRGIAIVDGGSFVLPYDYQLVKALAERGSKVDFYGSATRYNGGFLQALARLASVRVFSRPVSSSVSPRWKGVLAYGGLLTRLLRNGRRYGVVNLQFSILWPLEWPVFFMLRSKFVFTVHNAVPHGFARCRHGPTQWMASIAKSLAFVSEATREDFMRRYGERFRTKASIVPHGVLPVAPQLGPVAYASLARPQALVFWGNVLPYKGVELFAELARAEPLRERGLSLEVHGAWSGQLAGLRAQLVELGVKVHDSYLGTALLLELLARNVVFLLPYYEASQSGALYSLLNHGCLFLCADVGDLGAFMRRFGLQGLLLRERSAAAVLECLDYLDTHRDAVTQALHAAQQALRWDALVADATIYRTS